MLILSSQYASSSENQPAVTKEENQNKDQDQVVQAEPENQTEIKEQKPVEVTESARIDSDLTRKDITNAVLKDTNETLLSQNQAPSTHETVPIPEVKGTHPEEEEAFPVASEGNGQQCGEETTGPILSVNSSQAPTPSSTNQAEQQTEECTAPETSDQTPQQVPKLSASEEDGDTTVSQDKLILSGKQDDDGNQVNDEHAGCKENQAALSGSYPDEGTTQNTESSPNLCSGTKETDTLTEEQVVDSNPTRDVAPAEDQSDPTVNTPLSPQQRPPESAQEENCMVEDWIVVASQNKEQTCSEETSGSNQSVFITHLSNTSASNTQTEQHTTKPSVSSTVDHSDALLVHGDRPNDTVSRPLPKTVSPLLPTESKFTGSESTKLKANEGNQPEQPTNVENNDVAIAQEKQNVSVKPDENKTPINNNQMISNQDGCQQTQSVETNDRKNVSSVDLSADTERKPKCAEAFQFQSDKTISSQLPRKQEQQPGVREE
ncbi:hypothetical protein ATANTOWER_014378, partial [Ataeniobius toweri]|nr:hypothetical protein [Ataeniobius toweri]